MTIRTIRLMATALVVLACAVVASADTIDKIAAIVDNEVILDSEVFQYLQLNVGTKTNLESLPKAQVDTLKKQVLEELIKQKVLLSKARTDTVQVPARDVDKELDGKFAVRNAEDYRRIYTSGRLQHSVSSPLSRSR